uniref:Deoxyribonuclease-1 n=1 Tax=Parasteatoda tepidariorum TaxID=114398 RepID=A0A2L2Y5A6_PARTP
MVEKTARILLCVVFALTWSYIICKTWQGPTVERPLRVGAFNIQNLGNSKMSNKTVMDIVNKVLLRYDLVLVQEIVTLDETMMEDVLKNLNKLNKVKGSKYVMTISERLGRGNAKEQYAYIYRNDKFKLLGAHSYPDREDDFMRPPYIAHFSTPTLRHISSMIAIGIHTQPKNAANETSSLAQVYDYAAKKFKEKNAILMGDMNAGCANVRISDWNLIDIWRREEFTWLITHDIDTTQSLNCCPYDRIITAGDDMLDAVVDFSAQAYKFRDELGISSELGLAVSDHWPVEVLLKGGTSQPAKVNLKPSLCLTLEDIRQRTFPAQLRSQKTTFGFTIETTETSSELYASSEEGDTLLQNLQKLQAKYPQLISSEILDTLFYKVEHGALSDPSANDDLEKDTYTILIEFSFSDETTTLHYCTATTIN